MGAARRTKGQVRVNAIMPGFFPGEQNRRLLTNEDGSLTDHGNTIIANTPFGRFGRADELHGALHYLLGDASQFVTGTVLAVDGGQRQAAFDGPLTGIGDPEWSRSGHARRQTAVSWLGGTSRLAFSIAGTGARFARVRG